MNEYSLAKVQFHNIIMLFYVAPFQATFRFYYNIVFFVFYDNLDKLKQLFSRHC